MRIISQRNNVFGPAVLLILLVASACSALPQVSTVADEERNRVVSAADPLADNLFQAMNNNDYAAFSRDFDDPMKKALDEKAFNEMIQFFSPRIGRYLSRNVEKVEMIDTLYVISYNARFEDEESVSVRLSLRLIEDTYQVAGLWFDSPKLREK